MTSETEFSEEADQAESAIPDEQQGLITMRALNTILYGPPGTGKTFTTAEEAVKLCGEEPESGDREDLMLTYQRLREEGRIEFVTFHQSMSYEEFVEGRQPTTDPGEDDASSSVGFRLETVPGIFKLISERAGTRRGRSTGDAAITVEGRQVFKLSIGRAAKLEDAHLFEEAITGGYALISYEDIDWSDDKYAEKSAILEACKAKGLTDVSDVHGAVKTPHIFRNLVRKGDIVIVSKGNSLFRAIGEVTGDYEFHPRPGGGYAHRRAVHWHWTDREGVPVSEIYTLNFLASTIYKLKKEGLDIPALERYLNSQQSDGIAERAKESRGQSTEDDAITVEDRQVFTMRIGKYNKREDAHLFEDAINGGYASIDNGDIDWSDDKYAEKSAILEACKAKGLTDVSDVHGAVKTPHIFRNRVSVGDIVIVSNGSTRFQAIGILTGDYESHPRPEGGYDHRRAVHWHWTDREGVPVSEIYEKGLWGQTIYRLTKKNINLPVLEHYLNGQQTDGIAERTKESRGKSTEDDAITVIGRKVFHVLIGSVKKSDDVQLFEEAMAGGYVLMDFKDGDIDWSDDKYAKQDAIIEACKAKGLTDVNAQKGFVNSPHLFRNRVSVGDIVIVSKRLEKFRAIGVFTGDYKYHPRPEGGYPHRRAVRWHWNDREGVPASKFLNSKGIAWHQIYEFKQDDLNIPVLEHYLNSQQTVGIPETEPFVLIIDEINRANISKVFGELITLLEPDKRLGQPNALTVRLPYSGDDFGVPSNLHILGTMNTADRSIALLDTALRRRFTFHEMMPDPSKLEEAFEKCGLDLPRILTTINERIEYLYDREHQIGHAYFMDCETQDEVDRVMREKVIPLLAEYFFEDWGKIAAVLGDAVNDDERREKIEGRFLNRSVLHPPPGLKDGDDSPRYRWEVRSKEERFDYTELIKT